MSNFLIPILYKDAPNYMRNEPQRTQRTQRKKENLAQPHKEMVLAEILYKNHSF
jgi:hypothetical protein